MRVGDQHQTFGCDPARPVHTMTSYGNRQDCPVVTSGRLRTLLQACPYIHYSQPLYAKVSKTHACSTEKPAASPPCSAASCL